MNYYVTVKEISYYNVFVEDAANEAEAAELAKEMVDSRECDDPYDREYKVTEGGIEETDSDEDEEDEDCEENNCEAGTYDCDTCPNNGDCIRQNE